MPWPNDRTLENKECKQVLPPRSRMHRYQQPRLLLCGPSSSPDTQNIQRNVGNTQTPIGQVMQHFYIHSLVRITFFEQANGHQAPVSGLACSPNRKTGRKTSSWALRHTHVCSRGRCKGQGGTHLLSSVGSPVVESVTNKCHEHINARTLYLQVITSCILMKSSQNQVDVTYLGRTEENWW